MFKLPANELIWVIDRPQIMGILNITPDSFYAHSRHDSIHLAIEKACQFVEEGASIIDIGGQSTRPGAAMIDFNEELDRVLPIVESIKKHCPNLLISVDTFRTEVARGVLKAGANIINDISCGLFEPTILNVVADHKAGYIGMHNNGSLELMHKVDDHKLIVQDVLSFFENRINVFKALGLQQWVIDPGFGFGKTIQQNFELVRQLNEFTSFQLPILLGVSRKSSIYKTLGITADDALNGTTMMNTIGLLNGASILRVHDVKEAFELVQLLPFIQ